MIADDGKQNPSSRAESSDVRAVKSQDPGLDRAIQARIGDRLRALYETYAEEPVSDRLAEVLKRLESGEKS